MVGRYEGSVQRLRQQREYAEMRIVTGPVLGAHTMTLHLWGDARDVTARQPAAILLDDLPPSR